VKLLDCNAWLGHYPFRPVPHTTPDGLLRLMDRHGIECALVSNLHCVFYADPHNGNEELAVWVRPHRDRLIPCATLNPAYPGWDRDLRQCHEEWGMPGLRLFPNHHRFSLASSACLDLVRAATVRKLHVAIPQRLEDRRLARACPDATLLVLEAIGVEHSSFIGDPSLAGAKVLFEFSRMATVLQHTIPSLLDTLGPTRLLFGTGMPLKIPGPAVLKLDLLEALPEVKARLAYMNAERLLAT
jgi:uncharacterized protein